MIEDCKYVLLPVHKEGEDNKPLYFHNAKEIVSFLHLRTSNDVAKAILDGRRLRKRYYVDLNADYIWDNEEQAQTAKGKKLITDIYGLV